MGGSSSPGSSRTSSHSRTGDGASSTGTSKRARRHLTDDEVIQQTLQANIIHFLDQDAKRLAAMLPTVKPDDIEIQVARRHSATSLSHADTEITGSNELAVTIYFNTQKISPVEVTSALNSAIGALQPTPSEGGKLDGKKIIAVNSKNFEISSTTVRPHYEKKAFSSLKQGVLGVINAEISRLTTTSKILSYILPYYGNEQVRTAKTRALVSAKFLILQTTDDDSIRKIMYCMAQFRDESPNQQFAYAGRNILLDYAAINRPQNVVFDQYIGKSDTRACDNLRKGFANLDTKFHTKLTQQFSVVSNPDIAL